MPTQLNNYHLLVTKVDEYCRDIVQTLGTHLACARGCSGCCTPRSLFPVEAAALYETFVHLPQEEASFIQKHLASHEDDERCPLLSDDLCLLYSARPIICRTHGLPVLYRNLDAEQVDWCPMNLTECATVAGTSVIDIDRLNAMLVAVNAHFLSENPEWAILSERYSIIEALRGI